MSAFLFPEWSNRVRDLAAPMAAGGGLVALIVVWLGFSPQTIAVGYQPEQPIEYSHALHAGELGIDCRYCHTTVEVAALAATPPTATCMNCHANIRTDSDKLQLLRDSHTNDRPISWIKVHDLPDYAYFNHSAHVNKGVGCVECHGRVDRMEVVTQKQPLSMGWCLDCHRDPAPYLRPVEFVTKLDWEPEESRRAVGERLLEEYDIHTSTDCSTCHR